MTGGRHRRWHHVVCSVTVEHDTSADSRPAYPSQHPLMTVRLSLGGRRLAMLQARFVAKLISHMGRGEHPFPWASKAGWRRARPQFVKKGTSPRIVEFDLSSLAFLLTRADLCQCLHYRFSPTVLLASSSQLIQFRSHLPPHSSPLSPPTTRPEFV